LRFGGFRSFKKKETCWSGDGSIWGWVDTFGPIGCGWRGNHNSHLHSLPIDPVRGYFWHFIAAVILVQKQRISRIWR
jgi:hypothetical protein